MKDRFSPQGSLLQSEQGASYLRLYNAKRDSVYSYSQLQIPKPKNSSIFGELDCLGPASDLIHLHENQGFLSFQFLFDLWIDTGLKQLKDLQKPLYRNFAKAYIQAFFPKAQALYSLEEFAAFAELLDSPQLRISLEQTRACRFFGEYLRVFSSFQYQLEELQKQNHIQAWLEKYPGYFYFLILHENKIIFLYFVVALEGPSHPDDIENILHKAERQRTWEELQKQEADWWQLSPIVHELSFFAIELSPQD